MPKEWFSVERTTSLLTLPHGARIHVIGVAGVAMAQLAVGLAERGYQVSGSDKEYYEPMGSFLRNSPVRLCQGYAAANVPSDVQLVVIGNAVSYGHEEVAVVEREKLPYTCFPQALYEIVIHGKHSMVVTGTHGKTTTTALLATVLEALGEKPGYFIGGVAPQLPRSLALGEGRFSVVEGDEYDTAFFAKVPKFRFYGAKTCIVNAIEFDHADIYPNVDAIKREFDWLVRSLPADGTAICCTDFPHVQELVQAWKKEAKARILTFGEGVNAEVRLTESTPLGLSQRARYVGGAIGSLTLEIPMPGAFNAKNALAAYLACTSAGLSGSAVAQAIARFQRVRRRQEVRFDGGGVVLIEDFAHHPTAVDQTLESVRKAYPRARLWGVFEPRSNTSRRKVFQEEYVRAFRHANCAVLCDVTARAIDQGVELLSVPTLAVEIGRAGVSSEVLPSALEIEQRLLGAAQPNDVFVVMSNGSFGGLIQKLEEGLRRRFGGV